MFTEEFPGFTFLILYDFVWKATFLLQLLLNSAINMCLKQNSLNYDIRPHALWVVFSSRDREGFKGSFSATDVFLIQLRSASFYLCLFIPFDEPFHIPALAQGRSAFFTSRQSMGRGLDGLFSHLAMKQRQWQHTMAWWWTNIRSNTWDDFPSDKDLKSICVFLMLFKIFEMFWNHQPDKMLSAWKAAAASPKKPSRESRLASMPRVLCVDSHLYVLLSTSIYVQNDISPIYNLSAFIYVQNDNSPFYNLSTFIYVQSDSSPFYNLSTSIYEQNDNSPFYNLSKSIYEQNDNSPFYKLSTSIYVQDDDSPFYNLSASIYEQNDNSPFYNLSTFIYVQNDNSPIYNLSTSIYEQNDNSPFYNLHLSMYRMMIHHSTIYLHLSMYKMIIHHSTIYLHLSRYRMIFHPSITYLHLSMYRMIIHHSTIYLHLSMYRMIFHPSIIYLHLSMYRMIIHHSTIYLHLSMYRMIFHHFIIYLYNMSETMSEWIVRVRITGITWLVWC